LSLLVHLHATPGAGTRHDLRKQEHDGAGTDDGKGVMNSVLDGILLGHSPGLHYLREVQETS
jgi:hypothetical protein